jgi:hypothetical protein
MSSDSSSSLLSPGVWTTTGASTEQREKPQRPSFSSNITSDRLRESERWPSTQSKAKAKSIGSGSGANSHTGVRKSVFKEIGLEDAENADATSTPALWSSKPSPANAAGNDKRANGKGKGELEQKPWYSKLAKPSRPIVKSAASAPPATFSTFPRVAILAFLIAIVIPGISYRGTGKPNANIPADGVGAGSIGGPEAMADKMVFEKRADSPIDICTRWAHQSMSTKSFNGLTTDMFIGAVVNGTVYIYGGQAKTSPGQSSNTWSKPLFS